MSAGPPSPEPPAAAGRPRQQHRHDLRGEQRLRVARGVLGEQRGHLRALQQVLRVVRPRPVRAQRRRGCRGRASCERAPRRTPGTYCSSGSGSPGRPTAAIRSSSASVTCTAWTSCVSGPRQPRSASHSMCPTAAALLQQVDLVLRLGHMDVRRRAPAAGERGHLAHRVVAAAPRRHRAGRDRDAPAVAAVPGVMQPRHVGDDRVKRLAGRAQVDPAAGQHHPHARPARRPGTPRPRTRSPAACGAAPRWPRRSGGSRPGPSSAARCWSSGVIAACAGQITSLSQRSSGRSSASPRRNVCERCVWPLTRPGRTAMCRASIVRSARPRHSAGAGPDAEPRRPLALDRNPAQVLRSSRGCAGRKQRAVLDQEGRS